MKNTFTHLCALSALLLASTALSANGPAFPRDQTQGKVRCVLMSVGQITVFPNGNADEPTHGDRQGVPCLTITYLIERLGDEPFRDIALQEVEISSGGKPLKLLVPSQSGMYTKTFDYSVYHSFLDFTKPSVSDPTRAVIVQHVKFAAVPNLRPFDLLITAGFDKDVSAFRFSSEKLQ